MTELDLEVMCIFVHSQGLNIEKEVQPIIRPKPIL